MLDTLLAIPLVLRLGGLFLLGTILGGQANRGIYRLAYQARNIGPWSPPASAAPPRRWYDRIPVFGWWFLRREASLHGAGFWIRPLLLELVIGTALAWWYYFLIEGGQFAPALFFNRTDAIFVEMVHAQFLAQAVLLLLMTVATFIDFDEQTIPDAITTPGTLLGLLLAALVPLSRLPVAEYPPGPPWLPPIPGTLHVASPAPWPAWLDGTAGLLCGLLCFCGWCYAIGPRLWTTRRGFLQAVRYHLAHLARRAAWRYVGLLACLGCAGIALAWLWLGLDCWRSLFSALVGMAFSGGLIWAVRIVGSRSLGMEAMGFGDVTLMAMIGAFLGWQPSLLVFFLAPFAALLIAVTQWLLTRRHAIAFGPYLCLGALLLLAGWVPIWEERAHFVFFLGWLVPAMVVVCLLLMAGMLTAWRKIRESLLGPRSESDYR